ncbi:YbaB/EbfC DNA-binding family protein [Streptomyces sp. TLI_55]|uniref:YbaB/EbfC family nucleoid-associated protein n=1 Tax=Streptomyces sp. TLI_55 TaxID=1938861 RepID=UPI000BCBC1DE|nr:YbaB/EbfC family nucleoid-associated protein [Streptomyces sp. TLI_55]SNX88309.1 YbaB/EbfC DNA-binding family protein [Streptomyces sp. TLI_55]
METPPVRRLEQALADFAQRYAALTRTREQLRALSVTACSRDEVVQVTVGVDGCPASIRFVGERFRQMPPAQLGDSVVEALGTAQAEVAARLSAAMTSAGLPVQAARETPGPRPQRPLWGRRSFSPHAPLPPDLRAAVMALTDSVCDAVRCV